MPRPGPRSYALALPITHSRRYRPDGIITAVTRHLHGASVMLAAVVAAAGISLAAQGAPPDALLAKIGAYVETYYGRAQSLVTDEVVQLQPLERDLSPAGFARRLQYEVRLEWDPASPEPATVVRQLVRVNGRLPRDRDEPRCIDPRPSSPEALAALLPANQRGYRFSMLGTRRMNDRAASYLEYVQAAPSRPVVEWTEDCAHVELPGRTRTRIWADPETGEILRLDEQLVGWVDIPVPHEQQRMSGPSVLTIERADTTIRYAPVRFRDPDEQWTLPSQVESVVIIRNSGTPRMRITQSFSNYRRFVTASRVLP